MSDPSLAVSGFEPALGQATYYNRRRFLTTSTAVVGALAMGVQQSKAFFFFGGKTNLNVDELPQEWVSSQGENLQAYARHVASLKLKNITVHEVIKAHARQKGIVWNQIPPKELWKNMDSSLHVADNLIEALGVGLSEIVSAYRCPVYNSRCPGAKTRSYHMQNSALDLIFNAPPSRVARVARELRNNGLFQGGVGRYPNFTHIDTRGYNADW